MITKTLKEKIKASDALYGIYLFFFRRKIYQANKKERVFYKGLIPPAAVIFDIGANCGHKCEVFAKLGPSRIIALEPDRTNYELLLRKFSGKEKVQVLPLAASDAKGTASFYMLEPGSAYNTLSLKWKETLEDSAANRWHDARNFQQEIKVDTTTLDELIKEYGKPAFIKIDVEGNELSCIQGLSQKVAIISIEANLPEFRTETLAILDHLHGIDPDVRFNFMRNDESFELGEHLNHAGFHSLISSTAIRYMEIFSFMGK